MADILIHGMEMPKYGCSHCFLRDGNYCSRIDNDEGVVKYARKSERHPDCPLIEIPPHGRLIDADRLAKSIKDSVDECHKWANEVEGEEMYARVSQALGTFVECALRVKNAPTIIPAESEGQK